MPGVFLGAYSFDTVEHQANDTPLTGCESTMPDDREPEADAQHRDPDEERHHRRNDQRDQEQEKQPPSQIDLETRSQSRLGYRTLQFTPYDEEDLEPILKAGADQVFGSHALGDHVVETVAKKTVEDLDRFWGPPPRHRNPTPGRS